MDAPEAGCDQPQGQAQAGPSTRQQAAGVAPIMTQPQQRDQEERAAAMRLKHRQKEQRGRLPQGQGEHAAVGSPAASSSSAVSAPAPAPADAVSAKQAVIEAALASGPLGAQSILELFQMPSGPVDEYQEQQVSQFIRESPCDSGLYLARAGLYLAAGRHREALEDASTALMLQPGDTSAVYTKAVAREGLGDLKASRQMLLPA